VIPPPPPRVALLAEMASRVVALIIMTSACPCSGRRRRLSHQPVEIIIASGLFVVPIPFAPCRFPSIEPVVLYGALYSLCAPSFNLLVMSKMERRGSKTFLFSKSFGVLRETSIPRVFILQVRCFGLRFPPFVPVLFFSCRPSLFYCVGFPPARPGCLVSWVQIFVSLPFLRFYGWFFCISFPGFRPSSAGRVILPAGSSLPDRVPFLRRRSVFSSGKRLVRFMTAQHRPFSVCSFLRFDRYRLAHPVAGEH